MLNDVQQEGSLDEDARINLACDLYDKGYLVDNALEMSTLDGARERERGSFDPKGGDGVMITKRQDT